jgi:hypothetical protein
MASPKLKKKNFDRARIEIRGANDRPWGIRFVSGETVRYIELEDGAELKLAAVFEKMLRDNGIAFQAFTESTLPEFEAEPKKKKG